MKTQNILLIPIAFVAGIVSIVLLERGGLVRINPAGSANPAVTSGLTLDSQASGTTSESVDVDATNISSDRTATSNIVASELNGSLSSERLSDRIDELQQQLRSATVSADIMQSKIKQIEQKIESTPVGTEFLPDGGSPNALAGEAFVNQENQPQNQRNRRSGFGGSDNDEQYASLVSAGVDPLVAEQIKQRSDEWTLQRLELVDQATREGWRQSDRFGERLTELGKERPSIRDELGDAEYDRYLYVAGEFNRVQISSIINGSPAQIAGMENGDVVLSYASKRMFTVRELQQETSAGSRGELVQLEVLRVGEPVSIQLPRGIMGVTLTGTRVEPSAF